jgi:proteasome lid subunit RPN8/RPN11
MIRIKQKVIGSLIKHALTDAPVEACGYLAEKDDIIEKHFPLTNIDASNEHFSLDPKQQFAAVRELRLLGLKLKAVYHSHPATPARPSEEDIRLASDPSLSYVIVSLDKETVIKSFRINAGIVEEEEIVIV